MNRHVIAGGLALLLVGAACTDDAVEPIFPAGSTTSAVVTTSTAVAATTTTAGALSTTTTPDTTTTLAAVEGPCEIPPGPFTTHLDFDALPTDRGLLGSVLAEPVDDALAADGFFANQFDHTGWGGPVGSVTQTDAVIAGNPSAVTPDIPSLGTSSPPNVLRIFDEGHFSVVPHPALPGQMDYFGFNVGFGHFSEGFERPDTVELEVSVRLLPFHDLDGTITEGAWPSVTVTLGPGPQPVDTCVYLENTGGAGHPLFSTWLIDIYPRTPDGTPLHVPIDIDDVFYGCFPGPGPDPACATERGDAGLDLLAFTHADYAGSFYGLYVADPDAPVVVPLLTSTVDRNIADPAWSPDGAWIGFMQRTDPADPPPITTNLYIIGGDGSGPIQMTSGGNVFGFDWSPDGRRLVYSLGETDTDADIWIVDLAGGAPTRLTDFGDTVGAVEPAWSPDGTQIAFERGIRTDGIYWSSDLYLVDAGGGTPHAAITAPLAAGPVNHEYDWSPDASRIVYSSLFEDGGGVIWVVDVAAGTEYSVSGAVGEALSPAWSPAADEIAFFGWDGGTGIWTVNADGSGLAGLPAGIEWGSPVEWSSDGSRLAYHGSDGTSNAIWVINRDGTGLTQVTFLGGSEMDPSWSP